MKFESSFVVAEKIIATKGPVFTIAEAGVNHNGNLDTAMRLIDVAVKAGADAVKFQTFQTESLILRNVEKAPYQKMNTGSKESQFEMLKKLEVSEEQNQKLMDYCKQKGIIFLTTPFDEFSLDTLDSLDLPAYKVASTDLTNLPFLERIAKKNKPIFLSTGMCYLAEVELALESIFPFNKKVVLLQCSANYPLQDNEAHLNVLNTYREKFNIMLGYSDHTVGLGASPFAVAMGAKKIEKHFTLSNNNEGPDHIASLNPSELKNWIKQVRLVEAYLGSPIKKPGLSELGTRSSLQKCLVANRDIQQGELLTNKNLIAKRTGGQGISPIYISELYGTEAHKNFKKDEIIFV